MSTINSTDWLYLAVPLGMYCAVVLALFAFGREDGKDWNPLVIFFKQISWSLQRLTGLPGWSAAGAMSGLFVLGLAAFGLYWDVAWHIDLGRDKSLFTPSHTMILVGLGGMVYASIISIVFATIEEADVGVRWSGLRIPWSAIALGALGLGGAAAFPLDELWHRAYGVDVTLWSPTHLQLVAGGGLGPMAVWLMLREGKAQGQPPGASKAGLTVFGRGIEYTAFGAILVGLSAVQGEFDFGVPQFQVLYLPLLIAAAAGISLVAARLALGPGGAIGAVIAFLVVKGTIALLVAPVLGHTFPRFPLYLASALAVEAVAWVLGTEPRLRFTLVAGAAIGTAGLIGELGWIVLSGWSAAGTSSELLVKVAVLGPLTAVAAAVLGAALGRSADPTVGERADRGHIPVALAGGAVVVLVAAMAYPLPRNVGPVEAVIALDRQGDEARVELTVVPADAAAEATAFGIVAWQGGGRVSASLDEVGPGRYVSSRTVPVTGSWKTMVGLQRGDEVMAAPIYLPADPEIGEPEVPAVDRRTPFVRNTTILLREAKSGPSDAAIAAYTGVAFVATMWFAVLALAISRVRRNDKSDPAGGTFPPAVQAPPPTARALAWR